MNVCLQMTRGPQKNVPPFYTYMFSKLFCFEPAATKSSLNKITLWNGGFILHVCLYFSRIVLILREEIWVALAVLLLCLIFMILSLCTLYLCFISLFDFVSQCDQVQIIPIPSVCITFFCIKSMPDFVSLSFNYSVLFITSVNTHLICKMLNQY